ncbi:FIST signal transduction protein [Anaerosporobacter faecicola]|uniref:FIST signal transduction protein n=1 Tax=Anaerosporobacter faecicola TaxID=2718714 RepID=UPI00143A4C6D|nr:FIST N-terminal domain-containing protein [Anaerosporobacter faecicola]
MKYYIGRSSNTNVTEAVKEATQNLTKPKLIFFFCGVSHFSEYTKEFYNLFPASITIGSTTIVELCKEGAFKDQLLVLGIEDGIECSADLLEDVDRYPVKYVNRVEQCVKKMSSLQNCICFVFSNAFLGCEESVLNTLNSVLMEKNIPVVGGTAGNNAKENVTYVALNGKIVEKSSVFVLIRNLGGKIHFIRENIYKSTGKTFIATKVDSRQRIVYEYDHRPAADVIAEALNTTVSGLSKYMDTCPMGRIIGNHMYITANCSVLENKGIMYHARVYNNAKMALLEPDDYRTVGEETFREIKKEVPKPSLTLIVHCLARTLLFEGEGYLQEYAKKIGTELGDYVGFSGYGEQLNQHNFNQTMTAVVFE